MRAVWELERAFVKDVIELLPDPKPHYNSVSTMIKLLQSKGFLAREDRKTGNAYRYYALVSKADYQREIAEDIVEKYFDNSPLKLVNYFAREQKLSAEDLERILRKIKDQDQ